MLYALAYKYIMSENNSQDGLKLVSSEQSENVKFGDHELDDGNMFEIEPNPVTSGPEDFDEDFLPFQSVSVELEEEDEGPACNSSNIESCEDTLQCNTGPSNDDGGDPDESSVTADIVVEQNTGDAELVDNNVGISDMSPDIEDDAAVDYDANDYLHQQDNAKAYLEDFLLAAPSSSTTILCDSDSASNDEKGLALHRFPKIVKAMYTADYSTLQVLYRLLYLKNAWDTEEILSQRILEFSGFNCEVDSNDYYMREVILRTAPCEVVLNISKLLGIQNIPRTTDFDKLKIEIVSKIMSFLQKPKRPSRKPRQVKRRTISQELSIGTNKISSISNTYQKTAPSETELLEIEKDLKQKVEDGKAVQPIVDVIKLNITDVRGSVNIADLDLDVSQQSPSIISTEDEEIEVETVVSRPKKPTCTYIVRKKLRDFSSVLSSIEGTPDGLLSDLHMVLFLEQGKPNEIKDRILDFQGFFFPKDSKDYKDRMDCLNRMEEDVVKDITRALFLDPKSDKDATISHLLVFLQKPDESLLRPTEISFGMLSDCDIDIDDMSDIESDDSITFEVVHKKIECVDLLSSDGETDEQPVTVKKEPEDIPAKILSNILANKTKRRLHDFETITKIVNTHPTEYLLDIYTLLYMKTHEPATLRKDILDFSGFEFDKKSPDFIKRKQYLDRMMYNSVRRIYNTLIHNTREVKIFSKPTMIAEIFVFLFKLPDTDTSIRLPAPKLNVQAPNITYQNIKANSIQQAAINSMPSQVGKLSDLKRVFQRVACFPCEYLVDVHKLLFMTECDMKDIRTNIFGFKGFSFDVDSHEFNQRKLYLEYLTFHSLRKISSVLTTKTVDLRNSTKHELASHLTEVLKEYTNTCFDAPLMQPVLNNLEKAAESSSSGVEQIVVTPIIQPLRLSPCSSPERSNSPSGDENNAVSSSTSISMNQSVPASTSMVPKSANISSTIKTPPVKEIVLPVSDANATLQFPDVHLPEVEQYNGVSQLIPKTVVVSSVPKNIQHQPIAPSTTNFGFRPEFVLQQVPLVTPFLQSYHIQAAPFVLPSSPVVPPTAIQKEESSIQNSNDPTEDSIPSAKRMKMMNKDADSPGPEKQDDHVNSSSAAFHFKIRDAMTKASEDEEDCDKPLATLLGHPNDKVLKQQICDIVENTNLQEITINGVIQKIFNMYPQFNLNYRKDFIKSALRSLLYRLGEQSSSKVDTQSNASADSPDCSVSTTDDMDSTEISAKGQVKRKSSDIGSLSIIMPHNPKKGKRGKKSITGRQERARHRLAQSLRRLDEEYSQRERQRNLIYSRTKRRRT